MRTTITSEAGETPDRLEQLRDGHSRVTIISFFVHFYPYAFFTRHEHRLRPVVQRRAVSERAMRRRKGIPRPARSAGAAGTEGTERIPRRRGIAGAERILWRAWAARTLGTKGRQRKDGHAWISRHQRHSRTPRSTRTDRPSRC